MWSRLVALFAIAGCNQAFDLASTRAVDAGPDADLRPDLDHDGIADEEDPCIISRADELDDTDGDGIPGETDTCAFGNPPQDDDGDGIPSLCDPFPLLAGDRHRCTMRFLDVQLDAALWAPRAGEEGFAIASGYLLSFGRKSMVAVERVLPASPVVTVDVYAGTVSAGDDFTFGLWLSAGPTPSAADTACVIRGVGGATTTISLTGSNPVTSAAGPPSNGAFLIRVVFEPSLAGMNVSCTAFYDDQQMVSHMLAVSSRVAPPLGAFGFLSEVGATEVSTVAIYDRETAVPLP